MARAHGMLVLIDTELEKILLGVTPRRSNRMRQIASVIVPFTTQMSAKIKTRRSHSLSRVVTTSFLKSLLRVGQTNS